MKKQKLLAVMLVVLVFMTGCDNKPSIKKMTTNFPKSSYPNGVNNIRNFPRLKEIPSDRENTRYYASKVYTEEFENRMGRREAVLMAVTDRMGTIKVVSTAVTFIYYYPYLTARELGIDSPENLREYAVFLMFHKKADAFKHKTHAIKESDEEIRISWETKEGYRYEIILDRVNYYYMERIERIK